MVHYSYQNAIKWKNVTLTPIKIVGLHAAVAKYSNERRLSASYGAIDHVATLYDIQIDL